MSRYIEDVVYPRLKDRTRDVWAAASDLCVTPQSLKSLAKDGRAERYHDGRRWRYRASEHTQRREQ